MLTKGTDHDTKLLCGNPDFFLFSSRDMCAEAPTSRWQKLRLVSMPVVHRAMTATSECTDPTLIFPFLPGYQI